MTNTDDPLETHETPRARGWRWATYAAVVLAVLVVVWLVSRSSEAGAPAPAAG
jgi:apolipoprotein N-acyltransferase